MEGFCAFYQRPLCVLCALFGSPASGGGWWFSPASYDDKDYKDEVENADPESHLRLAWRDQAVSAHTSIDDKTKRAAEDHLVSLEVVRPRSVWVGRVEPLPRPATPTASSSYSMVSEDHLLGWLTMSLLFTRHVGSRRRRGWGRCRFDVNESASEGNRAARRALESLFVEIATHAVS